MAFLSAINSSCSNMFVRSADVTGFVAAKDPNGKLLDYVFVLEVFWTDDQKQVLKRTFTDFAKFNSKLIATLSGATAMKKLLPAFPGKRFFEKNTPELAERREILLNKYLKALLKLPPQISQCPAVSSFMERKSTDPKCAVTYNIQEASPRMSSKELMNNTEEAMQWEWIVDTSMETSPHQGLSFCYQDYDDIDFNICFTSSDSGFLDVDSDIESTPVRSTSICSEVNPETPETGANITSSTSYEKKIEKGKPSIMDSSITVDGEILTEEDMKSSVDIQSMTRRSSSYYSLAFSEDKIKEFFDETI